MSLRHKKNNPELEDALKEDWRENPEIREMPLRNKPIFYAGAVIGLIGLIVIVRLIFLGIAQRSFYSKLAANNLNIVQEEPAPRGIIYGRDGTVLADNKPAFSVLLDLNKFFQLSDDSRQQTLKTLESVLGISDVDLSQLIANNKTGYDVLVSANISLSSVIQLEADNLPAVSVENSFQRDYPDGNAFSSIIGYTGIVSQYDFKNNPALNFQDYIGKAGLELFYDNELRGIDGEMVTQRDAKGNVIGQPQETKPQIGAPLHLTIDPEFQKYFYERMSIGLQSLGRTNGSALAINPQNGEILAFINFPTYDDNIFESTGHSAEIETILNSPDHPLFDRAISGLYSPGSTIKPLVGIAALTEGTITPQTAVFSPGYLDIPNPYDPSKYTRYLDWRYQGNVNLYSAIAQSSDVYFYEVGGGFPGSGIKGLGIDKLHQWWEKFNLGNLSGIDLPGEAKGFLPTIDWKEKNSNQPWLLGDTYNVSIGQGDLLITPIGLLNYIAAIANGGKIYQPTLDLDAPHPKTIADLTSLLPQIEEVRKGMLQAVTSPLGTAYTLHDLPFSVAAKTGSAQVDNNQQENAFFVGYLPAETLAKVGASLDKQIAILILVEHSKQGSLNAVPIAKDVLNWYYNNRIKK